jgi:protein TonB
MTQLQYSTGSFRASRAQPQTSPQQRLFGIAFAVTMEAALVYVLMVALGYAPAPPPIPGDLIVVNVPPVSKPNDPPPPQAQIFEPPPTPINAPIVELIYTPPVPQTAISLPPPTPSPTPTAPRTAPQPAVPPAPVFAAARSIASTHTTPEYPFISRRLREQGTLRLKLTIDDKGSVTDAVVVNSSGFERLDEAAVSWVKAKWRYMPAMQGTKAVASMVDAIVEFRLQ